MTRSFQDTEGVTLQGAADFLLCDSSVSLGFDFSVPRKAMDTAGAVTQADG